ncbi:MAG: peptide deformylase [Patescibacteria group bacterium]
MLLNIQTGLDNPILRKKSKRVSKFDKKLAKFLKDLTETTLKKDGVGLAAPQVGVNERAAVLNFQTDSKTARSIVLVNPEIVDASIKTVVAEEGCLSLPGEYGNVERFQTVTVKFQDEKGQQRVLELDGLNARATQHEIDHLDGILFLDKAVGKIRKEKV